MIGLIKPEDLVKSEEAQIFRREDSPIDIAINEKLKQAIEAAGIKWIKMYECTV